MEEKTTALDSRVLYRQWEEDEGVDKGKNWIRDGKQFGESMN
jgi:hypothetical protein